METNDRHLARIRELMAEDARLRERSVRARREAAAAAARRRELQPLITDALIEANAAGHSTRNLSKELGKSPARASQKITAARSAA